MPTITPTARQKQTLEFIQRHIEKRGYPPSLREIAGHLGLSGTRAVEKHLSALVRKGHLRKGAGARALEITGRSHGRTIPIVGRVAAGKPILAEENLLGAVTLDASIVRWKECFLLKVKGESMKGAGILEGDLVLVRPQPVADSGEIVVAMLEGEATVKRFIKKRGAISLQPENSDFDPIVLHEGAPFQLIGKVVGVFRF